MARSNNTPTATTTDEATRRSNRSQAEWDELALGTIVPMLQAGTKMTEVRAQFGAGPTIRRALARVGYNTKGQQVKVVGALPTKRVQPKVLASRIAARREGGAAWWQLELETGMGADELRTLLTSHGHSAAGMVEGRMVISERGKARIAKAQAEAEAAAKAQAKRTPRKRAPRKAKVS